MRLGVARVEYVVIEYSSLLCPQAYDVLSGDQMVHEEGAIHGPWQTMTSLRVILYRDTFPTEPTDSIGKAMKKFTSRYKKALIEKEPDVPFHPRLPSG